MLKLVTIISHQFITLLGSVSGSRDLFNRSVYLNFFVIFFLNSVPYCLAVCRQ